jgi:AcrR family transcriptional regulator
MRADARRNYDALLEAASEVFGEQGVEDASLEEIAKRAGVGIGTLYRHFPARPNLVLAVYEREVQLVCDAAPVLLAQHPDAPDKALADWMQRFVEYISAKRGLAGSLRAQGLVGSDHFTELQARIRGALGTLVEASAEAGYIRSDVDVADLMRAVGGVCMATDDGWQDRTRRIIALLLDGLKFGAPNPR